MSASLPVPTFRDFMQVSRGRLVQAIVDDLRQHTEVFRNDSPQRLTSGFDEMVGLFLDATVTSDLGLVRSFIAKRLVSRFNEGLPFDHAIQLPIIFHRHFIAFSIPAVVAGVTGAVEGLNFLVAVSDEVEIQTAKFYHQKLEDQAVELQRTRDALFAEMEVAHEIQHLLLPGSPSLAGCTIEGRMVPAAEVGGDYYDVIRTDEGRTFVAIGDVSGHGVTSGLTMMMARAGLLGAVSGSPAAKLPALYHALNQSIYRNLERIGARMYMTFCFLEYLGEGQFRAVGRHMPILVYRAATKAVEEIVLEGMWLGVLPDIAERHLAVHEIVLAPGDGLVLYTDGITEHRNATEMFGEERLRELVVAAIDGGPRAVIERVNDELKKFSAGVEDDMTLVVVRREAT